MKIDYASDLHFNHWMIWTENQLKWEKRTKQLTERLIQNGNGEALILAGDFSEFNCQSIWILEEAAKNYERVYFTFGNHDLYLISKSQKKKYGDSLGRLNELIERASAINNVVPLIKNKDVYRGVKFAGDAMWYLPESLMDWTFYRTVSNDSRFIKINSLTANNVARYLNELSLNWYKDLELEEIDVFVSHVPPIHPPISKEKPNACYRVDVPFINSKHWICGHDHSKGDFNKAGVHFHMNALGYASNYIGYRRNTVPEATIDFGVRTFEV
ncbi:metallophosphoesterase family protein [Bacillus sp. UMB0728]|uniref:metallophosphoesterase family protein n=1 Tax=Bacillus sp. UMB0728 TaxID=2066052 RepID=UPI000C7700A9|nr:metallophosphoesterase [Bacillus sp. UMB0728]PLR72237.1 hypothetical protein CYJ37_11825 [Bacillus sp. UMB0728]